MTVAILLNSGELDCQKNHRYFWESFPWMAACATLTAYFPSFRWAEDQGSIVTHRDNLEGELVLPGFSCPSSKLF